MDVERFNEVLAASPKPFREELFRRAGIKAKGGAYSVKSLNKNKVRSKKLLDSLRNGFEMDEEVLEEVIRNYLYSHRSLLGEALDHFEIPHEEGLTDADLAFIDELPEEKSEALRSLLAAKHDPDDVELYLRFMKFPGA